MIEAGVLLSLVIGSGALGLLWRVVLRIESRQRQMAASMDELTSKSNALFRAVEATREQAALGLDRIDRELNRPVAGRWEPPEF